MIVEQILNYIQRNITMLGTDVKPYLQTIVLPLIEHTEFERVEQVLNVRFSSEVNPLNR
jgi:hypothetical protein